MHRVFWLSVGGKRLHLLKLAGSFFALAAIFKVAESAYQIFLTVDKINFAIMRPELIGQLFGWAISAPYSFSSEDVLGVLLGPIANFLFWLGAAVVALLIYQSGKIVFPIEEFEQRVSEHHRELIRTAVAAHAERFKKKK